MTNKRYGAIQLALLSLGLWSVINTEDIHKPTTFRNPSMYAKTLHHLKPKFKPKINSLDFSIFSEKHFVLTTEDDMIIIPSYLEHQVDKSYDEEMRITIVTNLIVND